jgi:hypothetical protein
MVSSPLDPDWGHRPEHLNVKQFPDSYWKQAYEFALSIPRKRNILAPETIGYSSVRAYNSHGVLDDIDVVILHKDYISSLRQSFLKHLAHFRCEFENPVFYVLMRSNEHPHRHASALIDALCGSVPRIAFIHLPKTAGTSIFASLRKVAAGSQYFGTNDEFLNHGSLDQYSVIGGHFKHSSLLAKAPFVRNVFSILRDPADRLLSAVAHARRETNRKILGPRMTAMRELTLSEFLHSEYGPGEIHAQSYSLCPTDVRFRNYSISDNLRSITPLIVDHKLRVFPCTSLTAYEDYIFEIFGKRVQVTTLNTTAKKDQYFSEDERRLSKSVDFHHLFRSERHFLQSIQNVPK